MRSILMAAAVQLAVVSVAHAAGSVEPLKGDVFMWRGEKLVAVKSPVRASIGRTVLVKAGGKARIICSASSAYELEGPGRFKVPAGCGKAPAAEKPAAKAAAKASAKR